jgi:hypothetical protein
MMCLLTLAAKRSIDTFALESNIDVFQVTEKTSMAHYSTVRWLPLRDISWWLAVILYIWNIVVFVFMNSLAIFLDSWEEASKVRRTHLKSDDSSVKADTATVNLKE